MWFRVGESPVCFFRPWRTENWERREKYFRVAISLISIFLEQRNGYNGIYEKRNVECGRLYFSEFPDRESVLPSKRRENSDIRCRGCRILGDSQVGLVCGKTGLWMKYIAPQERKQKHPLNVAESLYILEIYKSN